MKAKKTKSRSKLAGPPKAIKWRSSEVFHLRSMLAHVQSKLDRIHVLGPRLAVEAPEMQVGDLISRLRERKKELITKITQEDKKILKKPRSGGSFKQARSEGREFWPPPPELIDAWLRSRMDSLAGKPPPLPFVSGFVAPAYFRERVYRKLRLNHKSEASYHVDGTGFQQDPMFWFRAKLHDDAAWYRDDNPDSASWGSETAYIIPAPDQDAIVHLNVSVWLVSDFSNAADDGGSLCHSVAMGHTDPDGNWPGPYSDVESNQVVLLAVKKTDVYYSGWRTFSFAFETKRDVSPAIIVLFVTHLSAQDGQVDAGGRWHVSPEAYYYFTRA